MFLLHELLQHPHVLNRMSKESKIISSVDCIKNGFLNLDHFYMHQYLLQQINVKRLLYILLNAEKRINLYSIHILKYNNHTLKFLRNKYVKEQVLSETYIEFFKFTLSNIFDYHNNLFSATTIKELESLKYYIQMEPFDRISFEKYVCFTYTRHIYHVISLIKRDKPLIYIDTLKQLKNVSLYI